MEFTPPWESLADYPDDARVYSREALSEIGAGHPVAGKRLTTLARRGDCDDFLFLLDDGPEVAVVHLTWSSRRESRGWPKAELFADLAEFMATRMQTDRIEFGEEFGSTPSPGKA